MNKTRVLVVDDSALIRQVLTQLLSQDPEIEVVGAAPDATRAWDAIHRLRPDVLTLDIEMPGMGGLAFLEKLMRAHPMPVVMVSSLTEQGAQETLRALEIGAVDFVTKPKVDMQRRLELAGVELARKVKAASRARLRTSSSKAPPRATPVRSAPVVERVAPGGPDVVLCIGASTGGTEALREVLEAMPPDAPGIVIVQHMPEHFTRHFAERLDKLCAIRVREARNGDAIAAGQALIAPGGARHMEVVRAASGFAVRLVEGDPVNHHRPAVDVLFRSCARVLQRRAVGAILTGMGADGARGLLAMHEAGARTIAQDEATCVVFGMPREAIACGATDVVVPLDAVAQTMLRLANFSSNRACRSVVQGDT